MPFASTRNPRFGTGKTHYTEKIEQDSTLVEQLQYDDYLEEYARERFRMQRRDEQVYIVEEDD